LAPEDAKNPGETDKLAAMIGEAQTPIPAVTHARTSLQ